MSETRTVYVSAGAVETVGVVIGESTGANLAGITVDLAISHQQPTTWRPATAVVSGSTVTATVAVSSATDTPAPNLSVWVRVKLGGQTVVRRAYRIVVA